MEEEFTEKLLSIASQGQLMAWLATRELAGDERRNAIHRLAQLHSSQKIDVFEHLRRPPGTEEWRLDFNSWCRVYHDLIPVLDDDASRVVSAVVNLGTGLWEPTFHEAFLDWCVHNRHRIDEVLALEFVPGTPDFCLAAALIAGMRMAPNDYLDVAIAYALGNHRSRMPGIRAIAAMSIQNVAAVQRAIKTLGNILNDVHATLPDRADALTAALEVAQRCDGSLDGTVSGMVARATASSQTELLQACCDFLIRLGTHLRPSLRPSLLEALQGMDIDTPQGESTTDIALYHLFTQGLREEALLCLEILLRKSKAPDPLSALGSTTHYLTSENSDFLPVVVCRWLLTGDATLCAAARYLVTSTGDQKFAFDFDAGNRDWPGERTLYLARKAIGWLMPHGTAPASFLVCLLRGASGDLANKLGELIFDPLLINYPIATRRYLEAVCPNLPAGTKTCVEAVLARDDQYKQAIADVGFVPELQPSDRQRWIEAKRQDGEFTKARREAESKSVLAHLATRQTLLYGARAINYVDDRAGGTRRLDNRLSPHSYTVDNPMGWVYDPFSLDYKLRLFRAERSPE